MSEPTDSPSNEPQNIGVAKALETFKENLFYATHRFQNEGDGGVAGAKTACLAVRQYLMDLGESAYLAVPFSAVYGAFGDLEKGLTSELFRNDGVDIKRSRSSSHKHLIRFAVALHDVLFALDKDRVETARYVARYVQNWHGLRNQKITANTIINWRKDVLGSGEEERRKFEFIHDGLLNESDPRSVVTAILKDGPPDDPKK